MAAFFSIIMPTYNRAALISRAIKSVLAQTYTDWELVIVDDGSTDNTKEVVLSFNDSRIKYIFQDNAERSVARNNAMAHSTGTYICFLDSDDYYLPNRLNRLHEHITRLGQPVAFYYTGIAYEINGQVSNRPELKNTGNNIFDFIVQAIIGTPQVCIHRDLLKHNKFNPAFHIGEDMELWLRIAPTAPPKYLDDQFTVVAVEHEDRSVNVKRYNSFPHQLRMLTTVFANNHSGQKISAQIKSKLLSNCYFGIAKYHIYAGNKGSALVNLTKSIITDLSHYQTKYRLNMLLRLLLPGGLQKATMLLE
ncbi:MAG TPA: glycosyltransferase family A protein [Chitinophagales bacterium]|nr:glycosyltransferase family A protein [Chitinophagales bacterium]